MAKKKQELSSEELLEQALVREEDWPYEVPGNWVWTRLDHLVILINGDRGKNYPSKAEFINEGIAFINAGALKDGNLDLFKLNFISIEKYQNLRTGKVEKGDILYCLRGSLGKNAILKEDIQGAIASSLCILRAKGNVLNRFIFHLINSDFINAQQNELNNGTAQPNLSAQDVKSYLVPLPPLAEQQRIVDRIESLFDQLDQAKDLIQDALDSFETRKAAILHQAFTGQLTKKWREAHEVGMESWEEVLLVNVCQINPKKISVNGLDDNLPVTFVPMPAVSAVTGVIDEPLEKKLSEVKKGYTNFSEHDVIFAKITPCMENGKSAIVGKLINNIGFGSTEFHVLRCTEKLNNHYLYHLVRNKNFRDKAKAVMKGAVGQQRVGKEFLEDFPLYLPTISEQQEIVRILDELFEKEQNAKELIDLIDQIEAIKKTILGKAFRGELGTNEVGEESAVALLKVIL